MNLIEAHNQIFKNGKNINIEKIWISSNKNERQSYLYLLKNDWIKNYKLMEEQLPKLNFINNKITLSDNLFWMDLFFQSNALYLGSRDGALAWDIWKKQRNVDVSNFAFLNSLNNKEPSLSEEKNTSCFIYFLNKSLNETTDEIMQDILRIGVNISNSFKNQPSQFNLLAGSLYKNMINLYASNRLDEDLKQWFESQDDILINSSIKLFNKNYSIGLCGKIENILISLIENKLQLMLQNKVAPRGRINPYVGSNVTEESNKILYNLLDKSCAERKKIILENKKESDFILPSSSLIIKHTKTFAESSLINFINKEKMVDFVNYIEKIVLMTSLVENIAAKDESEKPVKKRKM